MWYIIGAVAVALILFLAVILVRAAMFKPREQEKPSKEKVSLNEEKIVQDMSELLRCKTISYNDESLIDEAEFERFRQLLPKLYPQVHKVCTLERIGKTGLLYHWKGKNAEAPAVLMSHYDVVPVEEDQWEKPAFEGIVENGEIWGRGTLDTKGTLCGVMEAAEALIGQGYVPEHDMYFAFSGQEEINGSSAVEIVEEFEKRGIRPAMVVDEGGAVVESVFPGVKTGLRSDWNCRKGAYQCALYSCQQRRPCFYASGSHNRGRTLQSCGRCRKSSFPHAVYKTGGRDVRYAGTSFQFWISYSVCEYVVF